MVTCGVEDLVAADAMVFQIQTTMAIKDQDEDHIVDHMEVHIQEVAAETTDFDVIATMTEILKYKKTLSTFKIYQKKSPRNKFTMFFRELDKLKSTIVREDQKSGFTKTETLVKLTAEPQLPTKTMKPLTELFQNITINISIL